MGNEKETSKPARKPNREKLYLTLAADSLELLKNAADAEDLPMSRIVDRLIRNAYAPTTRAGRIPSSPGDFDRAGDEAARNADMAKIAAAHQELKKQRE